MQESELLHIESQITPTTEVQHPRKKSLKYDGILMLMAIIWGATFLITKNTLKLIGPFTYLGLCYSIATITLILFFHKRLRHLTRAEVLNGVLIGIILFAGYGFQTVGLQWTSVSKAGFLTGLYVPLVPLFSLILLRQRIARMALVGVGLSVVGLLLISMNGQLNLVFGLGEIFLLCCAAAFALQVVLVSKFVSNVDAINLAIIQLGMTALLSFLMVPVVHEPIAPPPLAAWIPVLALGTLDMAFTLTAMNLIQQYVSSTRAALIYALEPMWAAVFGVLLAGDVLSPLGWFGCVCIFMGMLAGRFDELRPQKDRPA